MLRNGRRLSAFPLFLAGKAQTHTGQRRQTAGGDRLAAFAAAGDAVHPLRAARILNASGTDESAFAIAAFRFLRLIKNIHNFLRVKIGNSPGIAAPAAPVYAKPSQNQF
jgi:hypothetical protein